MENAEGDRPDDETAPDWIPPDPEWIPPDALPRDAALRDTPIPTIKLWEDSRGTTWRIRLFWGRVFGRIECTGLEIVSAPQQREVSAPQPRESGSDSPPEWNPEPAALTTSLLREVTLASIIREAKQTRASFDAWWATVQPEIADQLRQRAEDLQRDAGPRVGRPPLAASIYAETAAVYESAIESGRDPTKAVAEHFHVARSTAGTRVRRARELGFLPPTTRGRAGGVRPESEGNSDV